MRHGTRGRRRGVCRCKVSGVAVALLGLSVAACGARAQVGTSGEGGGGAGVIASGPGFAFECQSSCADGLSCIDGTCTTACDRNADCLTLATGAECVRGQADSSRRCAIPCSSDDACAVLGSDTYCAATSCVAAGQGGLPVHFDRLTLGRALNDAEVAADTQCDPTVQVANIELNRNTRRLTVATCEPVLGSSRYTVERTSRTLDDAELDEVEDAYRAVRIQENAGCDTGDDTFTLDVQPTTGPLLRFADEDRAACRGSDEPRTSAVVGLEDLYELMLPLAAGG